MFAHMQAWDLDTLDDTMLTALVSGLRQRFPDYAFDVNEYGRMHMYTMHDRLDAPEGWTNTVERVRRILRNNNLIGA